MSNTADKMLDRYVYLHIDPKWTALEQKKGITIHVKLDDEGVVVDAWQEDEHLDGCWKLYNEMGIEVRELLTIEKQQIAKYGNALPRLMKEMEDEEQLKSFENEGGSTYSEQLQDDLEPIDGDEDE